MTVSTPSHQECHLAEIWNELSLRILLFPFIDISHQVSFGTPTPCCSLSTTSLLYPIKEEALTSLQMSHSPPPGWIWADWSQSPNHPCCWKPWLVLCFVRYQDVRQLQAFQAFHSSRCVFARQISEDQISANEWMFIIEFNTSKWRINSYILPEQIS